MPSKYMNPPLTLHSLIYKKGKRINNNNNKGKEKEKKEKKKMEAEFTSLVLPIHAHRSGHAFSPTAAAPPWALVSRTMVHPSRSSAMPELKLSVSDLPMLSCNYIQKGLLFPRPPIPILRVITLLKESLSKALSHFPPLAGRLVTHGDGAIFVSCDDSGIPFSHCAYTALTLPQLTTSVSKVDVPVAVKDFLFDLDGAVCHEGHFRPLAAVRVTELADGAVFVGCSVNHAVVDGTSFWNFFNSWAELCRNGGPLSRSPDFERSFFGESTAVLRFEGSQAPPLTFDPTAPIRERIFRFSGETLRELKEQVNGPQNQSGQKDEISTFQVLCALLWGAVTRARRSSISRKSTVSLRLAVNCRRRVDPEVDPLYFGNAIQSIPTTATAGDVASRGLRWTARLVHASVAGYGAERVREVVAAWERAPRCFPLGNPDGTVLTVGSSPRFPMYGNDFGWGPPVAVRSGRANKFDGKASAFPSAASDGGIDLELCLSPGIMAALVSDPEFMSYVVSP